MGHTIFDTPIVNFLCVWISRMCLMMKGWKADGTVHSVKKYVIIAAPHTSNWDLVYAIFFAFHFHVKFYWIGKKSLFSLPLKRVFKWLGGIPIDRSISNNVVNLSIEQFSLNEKFILMVPPSGTRASVKKWKTGFYYIAHGANVPISLGFLDYKRKLGGLGPLFYPTGDIEKDMKEIQIHYESISGKYQHNQRVID